ncbi:uncharacterized protein LOC131891499 [Tigriopus californicus]|nr:uncharacterized protein LOC131891499 [Tigriopus californicus]
MSYGSKVRFPCITVCSLLKSGSKVEFTWSKNKTQKLLLDLEGQSQQVWNEAIQESIPRRSEVMSAFSQAQDNKYHLVLDQNDLWTTDANPMWPESGCHTFTPKTDSDLGPRNAIQFGLWPTRYNMALVFIHDPGSFTWNKAASSFGNTILPISTDQAGIRTSFILKREIIRKVSKKNEPCNEDWKISDFQQCLQRFFDQRFKCRLPWGKTESIINHRQANNTFIYMHP